MTSQIDCAQSNVGPFRKRVAFVSFFAAIAAVVVGCAALRDPYVESTRPDAATLLIWRNTRDNMQVYGFKDSGTCTGPVNFNGTQLIDKGAQKVVKVPPDKELALAIGTYAGGECNLIVSFTPAPKEVYRATVTTDNRGCQIALRRVDNGGEAIEPTFRKRVFTRPLTEGGSFCR
jgi:hypothetical protein